jgi:diaminopimelate epimerase
MKYNVVIANPANNITVIVLDDIKKENYFSIANDILNKSNLKAEQVGFIKKPIMDGESRLEMMGGEFCGNALRSFGMIVSKNRSIEKGNVKVEISGSNKALHVEVDNMNKTAKAEIPLPQNVTYVNIDELFNLPLIIFDGICHVIVENMDANEENFLYIKNNIIKNYDIEALGVMFLNREKYYITPIVYVRDTDTIIFESSCGSGTIATAIYLSESDRDDIFNCSINQPGGTIDSEVYRSNGKITRLMIGGKVELSEVIEIEV